MTTKRIVFDEDVPEPARKRLRAATGKKWRFWNAPLGVGDPEVAKFAKENNATCMLTLDRGFRTRSKIKRLGVRLVKIKPRELDTMPIHTLINELVGG